MTYLSGFRFVTLFSIALLLGSCGKFLDCVDVPVSDAKQDPFSNLQIEVGVDGSGSMFGYANQPGSRYSQAINSLSTLLQTKNIPARYWRIGQREGVKDPQSLTPSQFLQARTPDFYCRSGESAFPCVTSTLDQIYAIPPQDPQKDTLRILLTDLEPDAAAIGQLSGKISGELNTNPDHKTVLLGMRSEYKGQIFPAIAGEFSPFPYQVDRKAVDTKGRPFYLLISGPSASVDAIVQEFRQLPLNVSQALRLSSFAIGGIDAVTLDKSQLAQPIDPCLHEIGAINKQRPRRNQDQQWLLLEQECNPSQTLNIPSQKAVALLGATALDPSMFAISHPAIVIDRITLNKDQIQLGLKLDNKKLAPKSGQEIYITLQKRDLDRAVWQGWDTETSLPDGAKTQNLMLFIGGLRNVVENGVKEPELKAATQKALKYCLGIARRN
jgi:hypothetical protein